MSGSGSDEPKGSQREESDASPTQLTSIAEVFRELFNLLEQYAPVWYTEEHHNSAVAALCVPEDASGFLERVDVEKAQCRQVVRNGT